MKRKTKRWTVAIDIGGTKILSCLLDRSYRIQAEYKAKVEANRGEKKFFKSLAESIEVLFESKKLSRKHLSAIGVGCPGMIDASKGSIKLSPNIAFLKNYPLAEKIRKVFRVPVVVENDVNAGLYGEQQFGAAVGYKHVAGIFLGTGVGGALILNGDIYRGATGAAGEIGHTFLYGPSMMSHNPKAGTVEALSGRLQVAAEAGLLILKQQAPTLYETIDFDIKKIKSKTIIRAIRSGDSALQELIVHKAKLIGLAMANIVNLLNPQLIVLGGGVMEAMGPMILPVARQSMREFAMEPIVKSVKVVAAKLKDYSVIYGAASLASEQL